MELENCVLNIPYISGGKLGGGGVKPVNGPTQEYFCTTLEKLNFAPPEEIFEKKINFASNFSRKKLHIFLTTNKKALSRDLWLKRRKNVPAGGGGGGGRETSWSNLEEKNAWINFALCTTQESQNLRTLLDKRNKISREAFSFRGHVTQIGQEKGPKGRQKNDFLMLCWIEGTLAVKNEEET